MRHFEFENIVLQIDLKKAFPLVLRPLVYSESVEDVWEVKVPTVAVVAEITEGCPEMRDNHNFVISPPVPPEVIIFQVKAKNSVAVSDVTPFLTRYMTEELEQKILELRREA